MNLSRFTMKMTEYPGTLMTCPTRLSHPNFSRYNLENADGIAIARGDAKQGVGEICRT